MTWTRSKFHGERTNRDFAKLVEKRRKRSGCPGAREDQAKRKIPRAVRPR